MRSCLAEHQIFQEAVQALSSSDVLFYSVLYEDTAKNARDFISQNGSAAPILLDPDLKTSINYGVSGVPETFFIDRQGVVLDKYEGPVTPAILYGQLSLIR